MIVYSEPKSTFITQSKGGKEIAAIIYQNVLERLGVRASPHEVLSWQNSLQNMRAVLQDQRIPDAAKVSVEYGIPSSPKRIDVIVSGKNQSTDKGSAVIVELKQWSDASFPADGEDDLVATFMRGAVNNQTHPSYQAYSYERTLRDSNEYVQTNDIILKSCAYLHNLMDDTVIKDQRYAECLSKSPSFIRSDETALKNFIADAVSLPDVDNVIDKIDGSRLRPSKELAECLSSMLDGNNEFVLLDAQKVVYETALTMAAKAQKSKHRKVLIVSGGPGTGKSVVAINLLVELAKRQIFTQYVTKTQAPRAVYSKKLAGKRRKNEIERLFKGSASYSGTEDRSIPALLVDEAHRLVARSQYQPAGTNQIRDIIQSSNFSLFFIDEAQSVSYDDIGTIREIRKWASNFDADVKQLQLDSQFRCNGSDGYLEWLDSSLEISAPQPVESEPEFNYDFRVMNSAAELRSEIKRRNAGNNKSRMVAGYCWPWASKRNPSAMDIVLDNGVFQAQWNLTKHGGEWLIHPESVDEIGCIHTSQGLELDYVGVIIGPDLLARNGKLIFDATKRHSADRTVQTLRTSDGSSRARRIIQNTYRTLMTRGMKGCIVYSEDQETRQYFEEFFATTRYPDYLPAAISLAAESSGQYSSHTLPMWSQTELQYVDLRRILASPKSIEVETSLLLESPCFAVVDLFSDQVAIFTTEVGEPVVGNNYLIEEEVNSILNRTVRVYDPRWERSDGSRTRLARLITTVKRVVGARD